MSKDDLAAGSGSLEIVKGVGTNNLQPFLRSLHTGCHRYDFEESFNVELNAWIEFKRLKPFRNQESGQIKITESIHDFPLKGTAEDYTKVVEELIVVMKETLTGLNFNLDGGVVSGRRKSLSFDKQVEVMMLEDVFDPQVYSED